METTALASHQVLKISATTEVVQEDNLAVEEPLEIRIRFNQGVSEITQGISVTMRTPGDDTDLALGFLLTEGIIRSKNDIASVEENPFDTNIITMTAAPGFVPRLSTAERNFYTTSSCGVCGKSSINAIHQQSSFHQIPLAIQVQIDVLFHLTEKLHAHQQVFGQTGGIHASALFTTDGTLVMLREDVGRHNALDKVIGASLLSDTLPLTEHILLLSGRASFELLQKAYMAGIKMVASIGAPSSLAVQAAGDFGITLIGFLKNKSLNIYTFSERINRQQISYEAKN